MRIGIVLSSTPAYSETFFRSKIEGLIKNGFEVILYCQRKDGKFNLCPVVLGPKVSSNPVLLGFYFLKEYFVLLPYFKRVLKYIKLEKSDGTSFPQILKKIYLNAHLLKAKVDWLHFGFATMALSSETVARAIGAKMAVSFRGFDMAVYPVKHPGCYKTLWKYVDKIHTISDDLLVLAKKHGLPENIPVAKITPAIDVAMFQAKDLNYGQQDKVVFMTTGRLHWIKGYVQVIEALAILDKHGIDFTYNIIGEGKDYERIAFAAFQMGIIEKVNFLGKLPHEEIIQRLKEASIYIQYSYHEGFCNAVLEAQAMGKLCIVSDGGGLPENVLHGQTGWVVPKYAPNALAQTISKVVALSPEEKSTISQNAQNRVKEEFNIEKQQREFANFYN